MIIFAPESVYGTPRCDHLHFKKDEALDSSRAYFVNAKGAT